MTPPGIEPATFRLVAQLVEALRAPENFIVLVIKSVCVTYLYDYCSAHFFFSLSKNSRNGAGSG